ncbi:unnamed protein product, partial [marine sediment metagenome]
MRKLGILFIVVLITVGLLLLIPVVEASTLYEYYNTGDDGNESFWALSWQAQTFTPSENHTVTSVK